MINITDSAAKKLKELMAEEDEQCKKRNPETVGLRVFVQGGGCSGFQYGLMIENELKDGDQKFESSGIRIFVDPISIRYLSGAVIDFVDGLMGSGFIVKNPNAKSTCGCGQSFQAQ